MPRAMLWQTWGITGIWKPPTSLLRWSAPGLPATPYQPASFRFERASDGSATQNSKQRENDMRIAVIADIHGNLAGLEAALEDIAREQPDATVCLGDVAASGPQPHQVVAQLRELHFPVVMGNADAWLLNPPSDEPQDDFMRRIVDIDRW